MNIRRLEPSEQDAVKVGTFLLETFAKEHRFGTLATESVNVERAWENIWDVLGNGAAWVIENDAGDIMGSVAVTPDTLWWTDRQYLCDAWLYVEPAARKTAAFIMLLETVESYALGEAKPLVVKVLNSNTAELAGKFFNRRGYTTLGGSYIKEC